MSQSQTPIKELNVKLSRLRIAPRKVRLAADLIKGLMVNEAEARLLLSPRKAHKPLLKLLHSAAMNARNNHQIETERLKIKNVIVDAGPRFKRWMPRARGSASLIEKKSSHIRLIVECLPEKTPAKQAFKFMYRDLKKAEVKARRKKTEGAANKKKGDEKKQEEKSAKSSPVKHPGFFRRVFRRKSI